MKYKIVELESQGGLYLANKAHDEGVCVYITNRPDVERFANGKYLYHYKICRLYNNTLRGPAFIRVEDAPIIFNGMDQAYQDIQAAKIDILMDKAERSEVTTVDVEQSGYRLMEHNNTLPNVFRRKGDNLNELIRETMQHYILWLVIGMVIGMIIRALCN